MKRVLSKVLASVLAVAMLLTGVQGNFVTPVQAASKKTVVVSTQQELTKALEMKGVSKIVVKTKKAVKFTVKNGKYSVKLEMNAPKATITNQGTWKDVTVTDAKSFTEKAKDNKIVVKDKKLTLTIAKGANVKGLTLAKKGASDTLKVLGKVNMLTIGAPTTVKISDDGTIKKMSVDAKSAITLSGSSEDKIAVTLTKKAAKSSVKSAVPVSVKASANASITLNKGAEGSSVAVKADDAKITLKNDTKASVSVTKSDGTKESVKAGEKINTDSSSDNKSDEDKKDEDKKEEDKKEEEKKPSGGGGWSGSTTIPATPEDTTPSLTLDKTEVKLSEWDNNGTVTLTATKKNITGDVEWLSSNESVATVANGIVTYVGDGLTTITASAGGIQAKCKVTTTKEVLSAAGFQAAVGAGSTVTLGSDISGDVSLTKSTAGDLTIDMKNYTLTGNLKIEESDQDSNYTITLKDNGAQNIGAKITGNLTVNAAHAHVENHIWVQGTSNVEAVANATYQVHDREEKVVLKGPGKLDIQTDKRIAPQVVVDTEEPVTLAGNVKNVSVEKAKDITVAADTIVEKIEVKNSATTEDQKVSVKGSGKVTSLEAKAPVEVAVPTTELTAAAPVEVKAAVSNVYVESNEASIAVAAEASVESVSVLADTDVDKVTISGDGSVASVDVTNASADVAVIADAEKVTTVVATDAQKDNGKNSEELTNKIVTVTGIEPADGVNPAVQEIFEGEEPEISGEIKVTYSNGSNKEIVVTDKMLSQPVKDGDIYKVSVTYAGQTCVFCQYTYKEDSVKTVVYAANSMKKLTYTRTDKLDPTGAVITLTYASGKTEQITDTSKMTFKDTDGNTISTVSPEKKGKYTIDVYYGELKAGSQEVTVNPIFYTVKLDAKENERTETAEIEEFTTLNDALSNNIIELTETLTYTAHENRMWVFHNWYQKGDSFENGYSWDTPVTSDLSLIGYWSEITPPEDTITISVGGKPVEQGSEYTVNAKSIHEFLKTVTGSSKCGGTVLVKYGISGTSGDDMDAFNSSSQFVAGKEYEILYYTVDGDTYDGNWASIYVTPQEVDVKFENASNGIITNCDGIINAPYSITSGMNYESMEIDLELKSVPDGVNKENCEVSCPAIAGNKVTVQLHNTDKSKLQSGTYGISLTYRLLDAGKTIEENTIELSYSFKHVFYSKEGLSWKLDLNGDKDTRVLQVPYFANKKTAADYLDGTIEIGCTLAYVDANAEDVDSGLNYTTIGSLEELKVGCDSAYTIRVTDQAGQNAYFIFCAGYMGVQFCEPVRDVNLNCIKVVCSEPLAENFMFNVLDVTDTDSPKTMGISQIMGDGCVYYIWLTGNMEAGHQYKVELSAENVSGIMIAEFIRMSDETYAARNTVSNAVITDTNQITVTMANAPAGNLHFVVMIQRDGGTGWDMIPATLPEGTLPTTFELTTSADLTGKTVRLCICDDDIETAYDKILSGDVTGDSGSVVRSVSDVNTNCIKVECSEPINLNLAVVDVANSTGMAISQITGTGSENGHVFYIWLSSPMEASNTYNVLLLDETGNSVKVFPITRKSDTDYADRNSVSSATITATNQITVSMVNEPTGNLQFWVMEMSEGENKWKNIGLVNVVNNSTTFEITTSVELTGKTIRLCICDDDIATAYDETLPIYNGDNGSGS